MNKEDIKQYIKLNLGIRVEQTKTDVFGCWTDYTFQLYWKDNNELIDSFDFRLRKSLF